MKPEAHVVSVTTTSGGGNNTSIPLSGLLAGVLLNFHASAAAGTVTTIEAIQPTGETLTLLTLTSVKTDGYYPIVFEAVGPDGTKLGQYMPPVLADAQIKVTVASDGSTTPARADAVRAVLILV